MKTQDWRAYICSRALRYREVSIEQFGPARIDLFRRMDDSEFALTAWFDAHVDVPAIGSELLRFGLEFARLFERECDELASSPADQAALIFGVIALLLRRVRETCALFPDAALLADLESGCLDYVAETFFGGEAARLERSVGWRLAMEFLDRLTAAATALKLPQNEFS